MNTAMVIPALGALALNATAANLLLGLPVSLNGDFGLEGPAYIADGWSGGVLAAGSTLTDGVFLPAGHQWDQATVWWDRTHPDSSANSIEITLGSSVLLNNLVVQADDNDTYQIEYFDGATWNLAWDIPAVGGWGMQTRDSGPLPPFTASALRFTATGGDDLFAVSEIQASLIAVPEPSAFGLGLGLAALTGVALRRRRTV
jgi:hypothetical protein